MSRVDAITDANEILRANLQIYEFNLPWGFKPMVDRFINFTGQLSLGVPFGDLLKAFTEVDGATALGLWVESGHTSKGAYPGTGLHAYNIMGLHVLYSKGSESKNIFDIPNCFLRSAKSQGCKYLDLVHFFYKAEQGGEDVAGFLRDQILDGKSVAERMVWATENNGEQNLKHMLMVAKKGS